MFRVICFMLRLIRNQSNVLLPTDKKENIISECGICFDREIITLHKTTYVLNKLKIIFIYIAQNDNPLIKIQNFI